MSRWLEPVTLTGRRVRMETLDLTRHWDGLLEIGLEPSIWRWMIPDVREPQDLRRYLDTAVEELAEGRSLPFTTIDIATGQIAGSTRFGSLDQHNRRVEIGWTWIGKQFQRTHINTEAKYLMFKHAFETLGCARVEFKANALNEKSRAAMERIGAKYEGTLRHHMIRDNGEWRDSVYYSVIESEWPEVKKRLEAMMGPAGV